jgi:hypothetical protein
MDQQLVDALIDRDLQIERQAATIIEQGARIEKLDRLLAEGVVIAMSQFEEIQELKEILTEGVTISQENLLVLEAAQQEIAARDMIIEEAVKHVQKLRDGLKLAIGENQILVGVIELAAVENGELRTQLGENVEA